MSARSPARGFWPLRDLPVVGWLLAAVVISLVHPFVPAPRWLMIHLLLLGGAGHAVLVWSRYFTDTLLRGPRSSRRRQNLRLALFNVGVLLVVVAVPGRWWPATVAGAVLVSAAVLWHVASVAAALRLSLTATGTARFAGTVRYYVAAGALLPIGAALGTWLAVGLADPVESRVRVAHVGVNLLGWLGLTVLGTLLTLWPTMLRTKILPGAERWSARALPVVLGSLALVVGGAWAGVRPVVVVGLCGYLVGVTLIAVTLARTARVKPPQSFSTWSVGAGVGWLIGCLVLLVVRAALASGWASIGTAVASVTPYLAVGFVAQVLLGALSYLVPVVLGGGPRAVRLTSRGLDSGGALRVSVTNAGLLVCLLPVPSLVRVLASVLVLGALAAFVPILLATMRATTTLRQDSTAAPSGAAARWAEARPAGQNTGLAAVGIAAVVLTVAVGGALDPASIGGLTRSAATGVSATGEVSRVTVTAAHMRFTPDRISVPPGNRLVITVVNADPAEVHDLVLETGHSTGRLAPGERATVDVGVIGRSLQGWCSVVGHRQLGMVLAIDVAGSRAAPAAPTASTAQGHNGHSPPMAAGSPSAITARDATLPPLPPGPGGQVHRETFTVTQTLRPVGNGRTQEVWTFNGTAPGPILHGRVGDVFEITLVNDGTIGHSIDFHAGALAPDEVMRTIPPGQSLVYRFTAERAGIWMYHCSTMPMSAHIAAGLFGAVVIEPDGLAAVDRSYVLVQSEQYWGDSGDPVDAAKVTAETPDAVTFNGYPNQYDRAPLTAKAGERVRLWVLDAGPNRPSSFHVVGGQFDTVYSEGAWTLGGPAGPVTNGGAQVLPLAPAQGGFVELTLNEPGHYPFVSHLMVDAERGAHGILEVTR